jgi:hypothetical protein
MAGRERWLWIWTGWSAGVLGTLAGLEYVGLREGFPLTHYLRALPRPLRAALAGFLFWLGVHIAQDVHSK